MNYLDLHEAAELVKAGETVYKKIESDYDGCKYLCFTQEMLVNGIIDYYFNDYKYGHIDSDLHGWVEIITEYVELSEEEYQKWYEEYGEDDDVKDDKMDEYFTYEYVNDYVSSNIMNNYDTLHEYEFHEEDDDEDEDEEEYEDSSLFYRNYLNSLKQFLYLKQIKIIK